MRLCIMLELVPLFLPIGAVEVASILLIFVILFGADRVPKLAKSIGKATGKFEQGKREAEKEVRNVEKSLKSKSNNKEEQDE